MAEVPGSGWVAVRCVFGGVRDGDTLYEERITLWRASDLDGGIARAEVEAAQHATDLDVTYLGLAQAYLVSDEVDDGAEVFSLVRVSPLEPTAYLDTFFDTGTERQQTEGHPCSTS